MEQKKKDYTRRDSATAALRKLGVGSAYYNQFIKIFADQHGTIYSVDMNEVQAFLQCNAFEKKIETKVAKEFAGDQPESTKKPAKVIIRSESVAKADAKKAAAAEKATPVVAKANGEKRTVSSAIRGLIADGKTNAEIWAIVQPEFNLGDNKKHYPSWYRAEMARKNG